MGLTHTMSDGVMVCHPEGDLDDAAVRNLSELVASDSVSRGPGMVLDLAAATYVSSQGVAGLLKLQALLAERKRSLAVANPSPLVRRILYQAGVAQAIPIHPDVAAACAGLGKPSAT